MKTQSKQTRKYRRITPSEVTKHKAAVIDTGNNTAAVREMDDEYTSPKDRGYRLAKKSDTESAYDYIDTSMQQIGTTAVQRLNELVQSENEQIAGVNTRYVIDHIRGKAVQKSVNLNAKVNIQSVLD